MTAARRILLVLVVAATLCQVSSARAAFYLGGGDGIRVAFRTEGHELVWANVFARLDCVKEGLGRHFNRVVDRYAEPDFPLRIGTDGVFSFIERDPIQEESFTVYEALIGHVGPRFVKGRYEYRFSKSYLPRRTVCQTNTFPFGPSEIPFRARRVEDGQR